uniref:Putative secreted protein n=1 Tax=Anopheles marajoara TaxID=58244 RepID=A0A2M4CA35_9DIPT
MNWLRLARNLAISLNLAPPWAHPPTAMISFRCGKRSFNALNRSRARSPTSYSGCSNSNSYDVSLTPRKLYTMCEHSWPGMSSIWKAPSSGRSRDQVV